MIFALLLFLKPNQCQQPRFYLSLQSEVTSEHQDVSEIPQVTDARNHRQGTMDNLATLL